MPSRGKARSYEVELYDGLFIRWMASLAADLPMILEIARQTGGPILELGVGTGRVAIPLARAGHRVTGVDNAPALLAEAERRRAREPAAVARRLTFVRQDLRRLRLPGRFRLAVLPFNTLMHFESLSEQDQVVGRAARALVRGGHLWVSLFQPDLSRPTGVLRAEPSKLEGEDPEWPGSTTEAFFQQRFEPARQVTEVRYWLDAVAPDGLVRRRVTTLRLRWFHRFELERLLAAHGFQVRRVFGDFDGSDYEDQSPQLIVLARKR